MSNNLQIKNNNAHSLGKVAKMYRETCKEFSVKFFMSHLGLKKRHAAKFYDLILKGFKQKNVRDCIGLEINYDHTEQLFFGQCISPGKGKGKSNSDFVLKIHYFDNFRQDIQTFRGMYGLPQKAN